MKGKIFQLKKTVFAHNGWLWFLNMYLLTYVEYKMSSCQQKLWEFLLRCVTIDRIFRIDQFCQWIINSWTDRYMMQNSKEPHLWHHLHFHQMSLPQWQDPNHNSIQCSVSSKRKIPHYQYDLPGHCLSNQFIGSIFTNMLYE